MRLNNKIFKTLEFDQIKKKLKEDTVTDAGEECIQTMQFSNDYDIVQSWQEETAESLTLLNNKQKIPIARIENQSSIIQRLRIDARLNGQEIAEIGKLLTTAQQIGDFFQQLKAEDKTYPRLEEWIQQLVYLPELVRLIDRTVSPSGEILSSASEALSKIRRQQQQMEEQIRQRLNDVLRNRSKMLSDDLITIRNGRYVLPVKAEYRSSIGGTVHDQSATGQTYYMEPQAVVNLNNRLHQLKVEERIEIDRILQEISSTISPYYQDIELNESLIGRLDFIQAKAYYAQKTNATQPVLTKDRDVALWQARHPLIDEDSIVANDIVIGKEYRALIITGPNTGGKTILLKTLGLLQLMGQMGLHIPAETGSRIGLFDGVYADIGDEQSIEQSLSTFSSHMTNIVSIIDEATHESLLLFDELGSGTDPQEGAALAMAILNYVHKIHATVLATTHYPELKVYAHKTPKTINASMEFDHESLAPTYRLLTGIPGRSNALDISRRLGLRADILEDASQGISSDSQSLNDLIANLEKEYQETVNKRQEADATLNQAEKYLNDLKTEYQRYQDHKDRLREQTTKEANEKVSQAEEKAQEIVQEIRDLQLKQGQQTTIKEHELIDQQSKFKDLKQPEHLRKNKVLKKAKKKKNLEVGEDVEVLSYGQRGTIVEQLDNDEYVVQMGILKMNVHQDDLAPLNKVKPKKSISVTKKARPSVSTQLDLRGQRYEEAMSNLNQYLDQALLANHPMVTIIHGIGTGAIRDGVQKHLKKHPQVNHYNYSPPSSGGQGSTEVYFK